MRYGIIINEKTGYMDVDLGEADGIVCLQRDMDSIAVDVSFDSIGVCVVGQRHKRKTVRIFRLSKCSVKSASNLLKSLILSGRPKELHIEYSGMGLPIKESLYTELLCEGVLVTHSGKIFYGADEIYGKLL